MHFTTFNNLLDTVHETFGILTPYQLLTCRYSCHILPSLTFCFALVALTDQSLQSKWSTKIGLLPWTFKRTPSLLRQMLLSQVIQIFPSIQSSSVHYNQTITSSLGHSYVLTVRNMNTVLHLAPQHPFFLRRPVRPGMFHLWCRLQAAPPIAPWF